MAENPTEKARRPSTFSDKVGRTSPAINSNIRSSLSNKLRQIQKPHSPPPTRRQVAVDPRKATTKHTLSTQLASSNPLSSNAWYGKRRMMGQFGHTLCCLTAAAALCCCCLCCCRRLTHPPPPPPPPHNATYRWWAKHPVTRMLTCVAVLIINLYVYLGDPASFSR
jgi:hypothetical protein